MFSPEAIAFLIPFAVGATLGGTTAALISAIIYSRSLDTLAAEHHLRQQQAYAQGYHDRSLLALPPPHNGTPTRPPTPTRPRSLDSAPPKAA